MKIWEIVKEENVGKIYKLDRGKGIIYKYKLSKGIFGVLELRDIKDDKRIESIVILGNLLSFDFEEVIEKEEIKVSLADKLLLDMYDEKCTGKYCHTCSMRLSKCRYMQDYLKSKKLITESGYSNENIELVVEE